MGWEPPSESDFNDHWLTVAAYERINRAVVGYTRHKSLIAQLASGLVVAVARTGPDGPFPLIRPVLWNAWPEDGDTHFWSTGQAKFDDHWYFDVRFDINSFDGKRHMPAEFMGPPQPQPIAPPASIAPASDTPAPASSRSKSDLPIGEYDRLGKAIAAGWGITISEDTAWARAKAIFPDHNVRKREFLASFRRERGHKNPGKQPSRQKD